MLNQELSFDPKIPLLGTHTKNIWKYTLTQQLVVALFIMTKK